MLAFRSATVKRLLIIAAIICALTPAALLSQCPPGYAHVVGKAVPVVYNGVCCNMIVEYCVNLTSTHLDVILIDAAIEDPTCWNLPAGSPPPFSLSYIIGLLRDKILREEYPGTIPICPQTLAITVGFATPSCGEWDVRTVDPDGPGGDPEYQEWYIKWCTQALCYRVCTICRNSNDIDPCDDEPRLYFNCGPFQNPGCPGAAQPNNCEQLCSS